MYRTEELMRCKDVELHGFPVRASVWLTSDLVDVSICQACFLPLEERLAVALCSGIVHGEDCSSNRTMRQNTISFALEGAC